MMESSSLILASRVCLRCLARSKPRTTCTTERYIQTVRSGRVSRFQKPVRRRLVGPRSSAPSTQKLNAASKSEALSRALQESTEQHQNELLSPVHIPEDPHAIIKDDHPSTTILANSTLVIQRQLEMINVLVGFEQANKYTIMDPQGNHIGFLAEQEHGMGSALARQAFRTHRSFTTHVFDRHEKEVLRFHRPFSWVNSRIRVYDATAQDDTLSSSTALHGVSSGSLAGQGATISSSPVSAMRLIGEAQQQWAPLRRKYNLFLHRPEAAPDDTAQITAGDLPLSDSKALVPANSQESEDMHRTGILAQFAHVNEPFLSWDFTLMSADNQVLGSVNRNFSGFAREIFTDTGVYALRMDSQSLAAEPAHLISDTARSAEQRQGIGMTLDQRAVMLATAVSIDFDYFSRHSHAGGGGWLMPPIWMGGGGGGTSEGAAEAGAAGAGAVGQEGGRGVDDASPQAFDPYGDESSSGAGSQPPWQQEEIWGEGGWPGSGSGNGPSAGGGGTGSGGGGGGGGGGGADGDWFNEWF